MIRTHRNMAVTSKITLLFFEFAISEFVHLIFSLKIDAWKVKVTVPEAPETRVLTLTVVVVFGFG